MKKAIKILSLLLAGGIIIILFILFATPFGHNLRVIAAESILTSQHRSLAKYTFLSQEELDRILNDIENPKFKNSTAADAPSAADLEKRKQAPLAITIETVNRKYADHYFQGKLMTVSDPLSVKLVVQQGTQGENVGEKIDVMARRAHALAAVNASGFSDATGHGGGKVGLGVVIADGQVIHTANSSKPMITAGLTKDGQLITGEYSAEQMLQKQVISAASFKPQLIVDGQKMITSGNGGWGYGPRTIVAQKKDGTMLFLVIDGRQSHSIGASLKDCQDLLYDLGAVQAMAMDGGSSATIYALGDILNIPSTSSHQTRYLPNSWVVTATKGQKVSVTIDGKAASPEKIAEITGLSVQANQ